MLDRTQLAAALFLDGGGTQIRLYYQDGANHIRESSFDGARGWLPPAQANGDIVAANAKRFTPLTVLSSPDGSEIRLFYLNVSNNLVERKYRRWVGRWEDGQPITTQSLDFDNTKLASTGSADHIRVFYQATDNTIRQTRCLPGGQVWVDASTESQTRSAARGTSLGAVTNPNNPSDITLFYQGIGGEVESLRLEQDNWRYERFAPALAATPTPLAATSLLDSSQSKTYTYLFSLPNSSNRIEMVARVRGNSSPSTTTGSETMSTSTGTPVQSGSAIAIGRDPSGDKLYVFYQLDDKSIVYRILDRYGGSSGVAAVKVPTVTATTSGGTTTTVPTPTPAPSIVTQPTVPDWSPFTQSSLPPAPPPWTSSVSLSSSPPIPPMPPMPPVSFMDDETSFGSWDMDGPFASGPPPPPPPPGPGLWSGFGSGSSFFTGPPGDEDSSFHYSRRSGWS
ncbi:hypothetical protein DL767_002145 [Monosporascus sp. MG133]|nr:hypothetical protein DL767_002145 [Monosporascus sp. MG133]